MTVVTRFAPSPTGYLHIGGARTALFNYLYAKHTGGRFLLRIEDTDRARSTQGAIDAILDGLTWLGLKWDDDPVFQFARAGRHRAAAEKLLSGGKAYRCYATPEELAALREEQKAKGLSIRYDGRWRDRDPKDAPAGAPYVIRMKAPQDGETVIHDLVQGPVTVANAQLDDMVLLRADGTPTYMLAVVVDDIDMGITHVIRGDDHLNNAFRQLQLILALGHTAPEYAHIPLIHGADGAKLSKRHGALGVEAYRDMGFLPEALRNYLLRLGWSHGDAEIISDAEAAQWFDIVNVGRGPSRLDLDKLKNVNGHYIQKADDARLAELIRPVLEKTMPIDAIGLDRLRKGMAGLKQRAKTLTELADGAHLYVRTRPIPLDDKAKAVLADGGKPVIQAALSAFATAPAWTGPALEEWVKGYAAQTGQKMGKVAQPLRAALAGTTVSPSIFEVMEALGKAETLDRLQDALAA
ncbi:MAG: glutamate--tRNA ligase [Rhodospirillaceae bacterium]|nr:glutamate--tRNA ligase [Rhodospirillaceae bacterium]